MNSEESFLDIVEMLGQRRVSLTMTRQFLAVEDWLISSVVPTMRVLVKGAWRVCSASIKRNSVLLSLSLTQFGVIHNWLLVTCGCILRRMSIRQSRPLYRCHKQDRAVCTWYVSGKSVMGIDDVWKEGDIDCNQYRFEWNDGHLISCL